MPREKLAEQILLDRPEQISNIYSADHMFILKTNEERKRPPDQHSARLQQSLKPEWYQLPALKLAIDPAEVTNVEFDRDLGPLHRKMIIPG